MNELNPQQLHPRKATQHRFCERALDYAKYRPDYPPAAIDAILGALHIIITTDSSRHWSRDRHWLASTS